MRQSLALAAAVSLAFAAAAGGQADGLTLMPVPSSVVLTEGKFRVTEDFSVSAVGENGLRARRAAARFMARLAGRTGLFLKQDFLSLDEGEEGASFEYRYERPGDLLPGEDESYAVTVSPDRVLLVARTDLGLLHGFETVLQLLAADRDGFFIPCVQVSDAPRYGWRGLLLDCARHFMPVEVIKRNLDGLAAVKMNVFHWHLTDYQGFRVESRVFPRLQERGSDGQYYSQAQVREVIAYAAERGIRVMPEFDIPGHSTSWFAAFPELAAGPGPYRPERRFGIMDPAFHPANPAVYAFFDRFFGEMAALFSDPYLHIGGDEVNGRQWDGNPELREFKKEKGLADNRALQGYFNVRILEILKKYGRRMVGWDEILQPGLPKDIVIQSWRGPQTLYEAARQGHRAILSNGFYIDLCQPAAFHYANDPVAANGGLSDDARALVLGGEATMWSELVSAETVDSRIWPRTAAIAERLWSSAGVRDVEDMYRRLDAVALELEELGLAHYKNQEMMLRRLAAGGDAGALKVLADVVEPLEEYKRHVAGGGERYTVLSPLTRLVDAAQPESRTARLFEAAVAAFLKTGDRKTADEVRGHLGRWQAQAEALKPLFVRSPA
ncbi:MAG: beta-hexosaminidase, partial [Candidatus Aminicenantes bacterium]|nr:beta-hexosaminidase [Candidatus Aminicenantes bacterium]